MASEKNTNSFDLNKIIVYLILGVLGTGQGFFLFQTPEKIKEDTKIHTKIEFRQNVDSLRKVIANEEFVKGVFDAGAMKYKQLDEREAEKYLTKVFMIADKGLANDSVWTYVQLPFLKWLILNKEKLEFLFKYNMLIPLEDKDTKELHFNWIDGIYPISEQRTMDDNIIRHWRDREDDKHTIQMISKIKDKHGI